MDSINWLPDLQLHTLLLHLSQVLFAYVLAVPIGWNRETRSRSAGLRTFPLVALGACAFILVGKSVIESADANARLVQGLIGGLGFLGGGAIIKHDNAVIGTATAASIWNTGAMGMAVAYQRYELAIVLSLVNFLTLWLVPGLKVAVNGNRTQDD